MLGAPSIVHCPTQGHQEVDALLVVPVNFGLSRKAKRQFDVIIGLLVVAAVGSHLVAAELLGTTNRPLLKQGADAFTTRCRANREDVDLRLRQRYSIELEDGTARLGANGL